MSKVDQADGHTIAQQRDDRIASHAKGNGASQQQQPATSTRQKWVNFFWAPGVSSSIPPYLSVAALRIAFTAYFLGLLAGLVLPRSLAALSHSYASTSSDTNGISFASAVRSPRLHVYLLAWSTFHMLEFVITARYNATRLFSDSFLISNGITYHLAHLFGITEFMLTATFLHHKQAFRWNSICGLLMMIFGQCVRSLAMVHAAGNFSHEVAVKKRDDHLLVTDGIYSVFRHPSYVGFFYWALGTQLMLGNPVSCVAFAYILWRFFSLRIREEERYLIHFFGQPYRDFKARTKTWIPLVP